MSNTGEIRDPIQILKIDFPKCGLHFGCGACSALGTKASTGLAPNFAKAGLETGFSSSAGSITRVQGGIRHTHSADTAKILTLSDISPAMDASAYRYVAIHGKVISGVDSLNGDLRWAIEGEAIAGITQKVTPLNDTRVYKGKLKDPQAGEEFVILYDLSEATNFATKWQGNNIGKLEVDLFRGASAVYDIYSIDITTEGHFSKFGSECFNTLGTCQDTTNFKARPWDEIDPSATASQGSTVSATDFTRNTSAWCAIDVSFPISPTGTIWEMGDAADGVYLGVTGTDLVFRAGGGTGVADVNCARVAVPYSEVEGKSLTLIGEIDFTGDTASLWIWDERDRSLTKLGTATAASGYSAEWASSDDGAVGRVESSTVTGEDLGIFSGTILSARFYDGELFDYREGVETFSAPLYFGRAKQAAPNDDVRVLPLLKQISTVGTSVNVGANNKNYDPLGGRATLSFQLNDAFVPDKAYDPYPLDRSGDFIHGGKGSFFERLHRRQRYAIFGTRVTVIEGYKGQSMSEMLKRSYLLDKMDLPQGDSISGQCRDILSRAEVTKALVPSVTVGTLVSDIDSSVTAFDTEGHLLDDYDASGTIRINSELLTYTSITDNLDGTFTWAISYRATDGSTGGSHTAGDALQLCRRYTNARYDDILVDLLGRDAGIEYQYLDLENWKAEFDVNLSSYLLTALITKPVAVTKLVGELTEQCASLVWWDERAQVLKMEALKQIASIPTLLTEKDDILAGSFSVSTRPEDRISQVWVHYLQQDPTESLTDPSNYRVTYIDATELAKETKDYYGSAAIRVIYSRWLPSQSLVKQTANRLSARYAETPSGIQFDLDAKDRNLWVGDYVSVSHSRLRTNSGALDSSRVFLITSAQETVPGERVRYSADDATLAGFTFSIAPNDQPDFSGDSAIDGFNMFITDNNGLNPDGSTGSAIS